MAVMTLTDGIDLLQRRAKIVQALLVAGFLFLVAVLIGEIGELTGSIDLAAETPSPMTALYGAALIANMVVTIATIILFAMWIYRAAANIVAAEVFGFDYTPGWAVGWYFIPFANLVKPFAAMRQIWNASHGEEGNALDRGNGLLAAWWATWLISNIAANVSLRMGLQAESVDTLRLGIQIGAFSSVVSLICYPLALMLVTRITSAQKERLTAAHIFT